MRNFFVVIIIIFALVNEIAIGATASEANNDTLNIAKPQDTLWGYSSTGRDIFEINTSAGEKIKVVDVDGLAYLGDMILGKIEDLKIHGLDVSLKNMAVDKDSQSEIHGAIIYPNSSGIWPNGIVPYSFAANLSSQSRRDMEYAIDHWNSRTNLKFIPRSNEMDYLLIQDSSGCSSWIGRRGGPQVVNLANGCGRGAAVHELGHAIGFFHEQTRIDRDNFVRIFWNNIRPDMAYNFEKMTTRDGTTDGIYDFRSIMHYRSDSFSVNGQDTILPIIDGVDVNYMGRGSALSTGDIEAAETLYGEGGDPPPPVNGRIDTSKPQYLDNENIIVSFDNTSGNPYDWIGLYREGTSNNAYLTWQFLDGEISGSRRFAALTAGNYEARLFFNDSYDLEARVRFSVVPSGSIKPKLTSKPIFSAREEILISFENAGGNQYDWIGLYRRNADNSAYLSWQYLRSASSGRLRFPPLPAGQYSARLFFSDIYQVEAETDFRVNN